VGRDTEKGHCSLNCKKYNKLDVIPRKHKSTDFICEIPQTKREKLHPGQIKNMFFFNENLSKLCAEGAIQNLLNMLHFLPEDMNIFGELATSDLFTLMKSLNESYVIRSRKQGDTNGTSNIVLPCPGS
jgi:hypothetical protein